MVIRADRFKTLRAIESDGNKIINLNADLLDGYHASSFMQLVYDSGDFASNTNAITISGLNGDNDVAYFLFVKLVNASTTSSNYLILRLNNDSGANYGYDAYQYLENSSTGGETSPATGYTICNATRPAGDIRDTTTTVAWISAKSGRKRSIGSHEFGFRYFRIQGGAWNNTTDNITSISLTSNIANAFGAGSRVILFKFRS